MNIAILKRSFRRRTPKISYFCHPDHLGSTSYVTDASGEVYQHLEYFAFGETFVEEHSNTDRTPYLFNGKELDEETGLYYYGARYYDARTSVWVSFDELAEEPEQIDKSPYAYAWNNPILYNDPDGNCPNCWEFTKGVGRGVASGAKGTWDFVTNSAWKAETWKGTGNLLLGAAAMGQTGNIGNLYAVDAALGTNTVGAVQGVSNAIDATIDKVANGNAGDRGEVFGEVLWAVAESVAGSKGAGALTKSKTAGSILTKVDDVKITKPYSRPTNATTAAQRKSVQGQACVDCGSTGKMVADHKTPLVKEYYGTGKIDTKRMHDMNSVQPQCQTCSSKQGAQLRKYSMEEKKTNGLD